jgi:alginate O-acetyltransferase complex protein AlgI
MLFNSFEFLLFFPIITVLYFLLPYKFRWVLLLAASCFFYMFFIPKYILILFFTIIIDYYAGIQLERIENKKKRKWFLIASLIANIGILVIFKYYNFINGNITAVLDAFHSENPIPVLNIILPIGLSFHTFQAMSYTIEVYRGNQKAEKHFGVYALYVMYYPQLVAGPIERPQNVLWQFKIDHKPDYERIRSGLMQMIWGLFKKVVIADRLTLFVDAVYKDPTSYSGMPLIWSTIFFSFQIYCDFSGYSDMALGASKVLGIDLMQNFRMPYLSKSIKSFWGRWHISLSTWFRDYLYIPLGGNRVSKARWYFNLFFVFMVSGFWHGANWTFVAWGALHGVYLIFGILLEPIEKKYFNQSNIVSNVLKRLFVFVLVAVAWVFFRANSISDALYIISHFHKIDTNYLFGVASASTVNNMLSIALIIGLIISDYYFEWAENNTKILQNNFLRYALAIILLVLIYTIGVFESASFIYFQF